MDQTWQILQRGVFEKPARKLKNPAAIRKSIRRHPPRGNAYITLIYDCDRSTVDVMSDVQETSRLQAAESPLFAMFQVVPTARQLMIQKSRRPLVILPQRIS